MYVYSCDTDMSFCYYYYYPAKQRGSLIESCQLTVLHIEMSHMTWQKKDGFISTVSTVLVALQLLRGGGTRPVLSQFCSGFFRFFLSQHLLRFESHIHLPTTSTTSNLLFLLVCSCLLGENPKHSGSLTDSLHRLLFICHTE